MLTQIKPKIKEKYPDDIVFITVRVSRQERVEIRQKAKNLNISLQELCISAIRNKLNQEEIEEIK